MSIVAAFVAAIPAALCAWGLLVLFSKKLDARLGEWPAFWLRLVLTPVAAVLPAMFLAGLLGDDWFPRIVRLLSMVATFVFAFSVYEHKEFDARHGKLRALSFRLLLAPVAFFWGMFNMPPDFGSLIIVIGIAVPGSFLYVYPKSPVAWMGVGVWYGAWVIRAIQYW